MTFNEVSSTFCRGSGQALLPQHTSLICNVRYELTPQSPVGTQAQPDSPSWESDTACGVSQLFFLRRFFYGSGPQAPFICWVASASHVLKYMSTIPECRVKQFTLKLVTPPHS